MSAEKKLAEYKSELTKFVPQSEAATVTHVVESGKGSFYLDISGKKFLDFSSGIFTNTFGHGDVEIANTLAEVFGKIGNIHRRQWSGALDFYRRLFRFLLSQDYRIVVYGDGGGYSVDRCLTELYYHFGKKKFNLVTFDGGFHGKTIGNKLSVNPHESCSFFQTHVVPPPYCYRCPFGKEHSICRRLTCAEELEKHLLASQAQVLLFEPVIGSVVIVPPKNYWQRIEKFCRAHGILMIADEVLVGGGRVGSFLASTHYGIEPDAIILTKGLANGLPLSVILFKKFLTENEFSQRTMNYSATFIGLPALIAVANKVLEKIERDDILTNVKARGEQLLHGLRALQAKFSIIGDVRGLGLMAAIEFVKEDGSPDVATAQKIFLTAEQRGLETIPPNGHILRFGSPLNITSKEIVLALELLERSLGDAYK